MELPTLYGEAASGKTKQWAISVTARNGDGIITVVRGYQGGKLQMTEKAVSVGKNIGRRNETTPLEQAIAEAKATWIKMKEGGYHEADIKEITEEPIAKLRADEPVALARAKADEPLAKASEPAAKASEPATKPEVGSKSRGVVAGVPSPMLAHDYHKRGRASDFPCFVQRKLDGVRCIAMPGKGLYSRLKKTFPHMEHILEEIMDLPYVLDGELFCCTLTFQEIVSAVKRETLRDGDAEKQRQIQYHVYDIVCEYPYSVRMEMLKTLFRTHRFQHLVFVETVRCPSEIAMKTQHAAYVAEGYEGIMLRSPNGLYKGCRSVDLLKYKEFMDDEYEVVGFKEGDGVEKGCVIWLCRTAEGRTFHCRPRGTHEDRVLLYQEGNSYVGSYLTVRFQELTDEGIPRFPVGIAFRSYE